MKTVAWVLALGLASVACEEKPEPPPAPASAAAAPSVSAAPKLPPQVGRWTAKLTLEPTRIPLDRKQGGVQEWEDAGTAATGPAALSVEIDEAGRATGTLTGAAGKLSAEGRFEDGTVRLRLSSQDPGATAFAGILTAKLDKDHFRGTLRISSGDSHVIRKADVRLEK